MDKIGQKLIGVINPEREWTAAAEPPRWIEIPIEALCVRLGMCRSEVAEPPRWIEIPIEEEN